MWIRNSSVQRIVHHYIDWGTLATFNIGESILLKRISNGYVTSLLLTTLPVYFLCTVSNIITGLSWYLRNHHHHHHCHNTIFDPHTSLQSSERLYPVLTSLDFTTIFLSQNKVFSPASNSQPRESGRCPATALHTTLRLIETLIWMLWKEAVMV
jgi:hypothetical protein